MTKNKYIGTSFDELLKEEGTFGDPSVIAEYFARSTPKVVAKSEESAELAAIKKVIAEYVAKEMKKKKISQTEMAKRIGTSRAALMRLLNPENYSVTLLTLYRVAAALGKDLEIRFH